MPCAYFLRTVHVFYCYIYYCLKAQLSLFWPVHVTGGFTKSSTSLTCVNSSLWCLLHYRTSRSLLTVLPVYKNYVNTFCFFLPEWGVNCRRGMNNILEKWYMVDRVQLSSVVIHQCQNFFLVYQVMPHTTMRFPCKWWKYSKTNCFTGKRWVPWI